MNISSVYHQSLEDLVGRSWDDCRKTLDRVYRRMDEDDLMVHIVVLAHGADTSRLSSTEAMLNMLHSEVQQDRIHIWLSYQVEDMPSHLEDYTSKGIELIWQTGQDEYADLELPATGKTENILRALKEIHNRNTLPPEHQLVIFLDNDYLLYDAVNVHSLYVPWVINPNNIDPFERNLIYVKAGGMRLKFNEVIQRSEWLAEHDRPVKFSELCKESLLKVNSNPGVLVDIDHLIPTRENLINALEPALIKELELALDTTTQQGARLSRGLSCYLHARRDVPVARYLSEFSFLLHGDQGTSLANWMNASLAPGYGLELSFLDSAMKHRGSKVINVIGLPHAHHPKNDAANFLLGIEMYEVVMTLIDEDSSFTPLPADKSWSYYSPTKLGFKQVTLRPSEMSEFYQPLSQIKRKGAA